MIVEFTGTTCSGKTTLALKIIEALKEAGISTISVHPKYFDLASFHGCNLRNETLQNIFLDLLSIKYLIKQHVVVQDTIKFAYRYLKFEDKDRLYHRLNRFRSILRKVGTYYVLRSQITPKKCLKIIDEGTIHSIHNLFVQPYNIPSNADLFRYAELIQLPDLIIYVSAPENKLLERLNNRSDPPRRGKNNSIQFLKNAINVYEKFMNIERVKNKTIVVQNIGEEVDALAKELTERIIEEFNRCKC